MTRSAKLEQLWSAPPLYRIVILLYCTPYPTKAVPPGVHVGTFDQTAVSVTEIDAENGHDGSWARTFRARRRRPRTRGLVPGRARRRRTPGLAAGGMCAVRALSTATFRSGARICWLRSTLVVRVPAGVRPWPRSPPPRTTAQDPVGFESNDGKLFGSEAEAQEVLQGRARSCNANGRCYILSGL